MTEKASSQPQMQTAQGTADPSRQKKTRVGLWIGGALVVLVIAGAAIGFSSQAGHRPKISVSTQSQIAALSGSIGIASC